MRKRRYTNMQVLLPTIEKMLESGRSHREIEAELGLEGDRPVHNLLKRQRKPPSGGRRESAVKLGAAEFPQGGFIPNSLTLLFSQPRLSTSTAPAFGWRTIDARSFCVFLWSSPS